MAKSFNSAQAKLLAGFSSDLAKGLLLAGISTPVVSRETLVSKWLLMLFYATAAIIFLRFGLDILKEVKND